jgi:hypothetical protein
MNVLSKRMAYPHCDDCTKKKNPVEVAITIPIPGTPVVHKESTDDAGSELREKLRLSIQKSLHDTAEDKNKLQLTVVKGDSSPDEDEML